MTKLPPPKVLNPRKVETQSEVVPPYVQPIVDERLLLPQSVCAIAFGISVDALRKWRVKPRRRQGRLVLYYLPDLVNYRDLREEKPALSLNYERARLAAAQADRTELEVKQICGNLIPAHEVLEAWEPIVIAARSKILALPSKLKTAIPKLTDHDLGKIKTMVRGALEDLANSGIPKRVRPINKRSQDLG
jgi:phage terminase Nu1 subunit (DNA packaging protein)